MVKIEPRYFDRDEGLALDLSNEAVRLDRGFHRSLRIAMDPTDSWYKSKSNRRRVREMVLAREFWAKNEESFARDVLSKVQLEESASWTFSYRGEIEKLPALYRKRFHIDSYGTFKFSYPTDLEGDYQMEFSDAGIRLRKRIRLYIRGNEILPINQDQRWLDSARGYMKPPSHIGAEWFDYVMYMGEDFSLAVVDSHRRQTRDVFGDLEPVDAFISAEHVRSFLKWTEGDLLRASLHRHPDRPQEKYLVIRSLNRPSLWTPSPTERITDADPLPIHPDAATHLKPISDLRLTDWARKHGYDRSTSTR
jgi:hypothetical protein